MTTEEILLQISGKDQPGIFAKVCEILEQNEVEIRDIQQITSLGRLSLVILVDIKIEKGYSVIRNLRKFCLENQLLLDFEPVSEKPSYPNLYALTLLAKKITPKALFDLSHALSLEKINIERLHFLAKKNLECLEFLLHLPKQDDEFLKKIKELVFKKAFDHEFDCALQREDLYRRSKRLIVMDMDSTLIRQEVIDELARFAGVFEKVSQITEKAMRGELNFNEALAQRVALLHGLKEKDLYLVLEKIELNPGAEKLLAILKKMGFKTAIVSGGFTFFANHFKEKLGLDYAFANELEIKDGIVTGKVKGEIVNRQKKAEILCNLAQKEKIPLEQTIAVGDGANDLDMLQLAGLGVAFYAKPVVKKQSKAFIEQAGLDVILYLLGISEEEAEKILKT